MKRVMLQVIVISALISCLGWVRASLAENPDGPFGLQWGMSKANVEAMDIRLCCGQLGKWGVRYEVDRRDFGKLPKRLGDEEKMNLYFGNKDQLQRIYMALTKIGGENQYNQINLLLEKRYTVLKQCHWNTSSDCQGYRAFTSYKTGDIEAFVGFEENITYRDKISITLLNTKFFKSDKGTKNPF